MSKTSSSSTGIAKCTYFTFIALMIAWVEAWLLKNFLEESLTWLTTSGGSFLYWTVAKVVIWIIPALWFLKLSNRGIAEVLNLANWNAWLAWGGGIGLLIALTAIIPNYLQGNKILPTEFSFSLLNVIVIAPIFEEFLVRGAIQGNLQKSHSFLVANVVTSVMFVILHIPGWYFMGILSHFLNNLF